MGESFYTTTERLRSLPPAGGLVQFWLKMYDKAGSILRLEMVINNPEGFTVRRQVMRKGKKVMRWVDMRKGVAYLFRYREVSLAANSRYLAALAEVDDPTDAIRTLDRITTRKQVAPKRTAKRSIRSRVMRLRSFVPCSVDNT